MRALATSILLAFSLLVTAAQISAAAPVKITIACGALGIELEQEWLVNYGKVARDGTTMRFEREPLDIERVAAECDVAILNANHGTAISFLRAGKPTLQVPLYVEQSLLAMAMLKINAALAAPPDQPQEIARQIEVLLRQPNPAPGVAAFAKRYADFDPAAQIEQILDRLEARGRR